MQERLVSSYLEFYDPRVWRKCTVSLFQSLMECIKVDYTIPLSGLADHYCYLFIFWWIFKFSYNWQIF